MRVKTDRSFILKNNYLILILSSLFFSTMLSATSATLINDSKLKSNDDFKSKDLVSLNKGDQVEIKNRKRGWYQVETKNNLIGWLTLLEVRFQSEIKGKGSSELSKLVSLRQGHSNITATTGVRGIGENDIKNAKANFIALESAKQFKVNSTDAKKYAKELGLVTQSINYEGNSK